MISLKDRLKKEVQQSIEHLLPSYFAMIMATGIVSIALHLLSVPFISDVLLYINIVAYIILCVLIILRIIYYPKNIKSDFINHARGPGFLTIVAGTNVLGSQLVILKDNFLIATILFYVGLILYIFLVYTFLIAVTIKRDKPSLDDGVNGIWLLLVVSTQSIVVLALLLLDQLYFSKEVILFFSFILFLIGCFLYIIIITLIFYRLTFFKLRAEEFAPPYWINIGAVAIITLAGSLLIQNSVEWEFLLSIKSFLIGFTFLFWATGVWWFPIILFLGAWRHFYQLIPITYQPQYWGMVFPLGMFTACTYQLAAATDVLFLFKIPPLFMYISLFAWTVTFGGLIFSIAHKTTYQIIKSKNQNSWQQQD